MSKQAQDSFLKLIEVIKTLRAPGGCDWDREQTSESLVPYLLEETYEVIEAIEDKNAQLLKEELGDLMLHILFQTELAEESGKFSLAESLDNVSAKLIRRHPHVFNPSEEKTEKVSWEQAKQKEKKRNNFLDGVPKNLPALTRARRIQEKASNVGFDWKEIEPVWDKVHEEIDELKDAFATQDPEKIKDELGDSLFALVNLGRFINISAEDSLRMTISKFENRFRIIEKELRKQNIPLEDATLEQMDIIWEEAKKAESR